MTSGWGHFHVSDEIFILLLEYLCSVDDDYASTNKFGSGANWKIRVIKKALSKLGISTNVMKHGYYREVFVCEMAKNARELVMGIDGAPDYSGLKRVQ